MTWTYSVTQLQANTLYQVRLLVGDTKENDPQLEDEEINFAISQNASIYRAAAQCCRSISSFLSRKADTVTVELRTSYSQLAKNYAARAVEYDTRASVTSAGLPSAGGISLADKIRQEQNPDRVPPQFTIGIDDNYLPIGPAGNETLTRGDS